MDSFILPPPVPLPLRNHLAPLVTQDATLWGPRGVISSVTLTPEKRLVDSGGVGGGGGERGPAQEKWGHQGLYSRY